MRKKTGAHLGRFDAMKSSELALGWWSGVPVAAELTTFLVDEFQFALDGASCANQIGR